jgi:hypothetical protein
MLRDNQDRDNQDEDEAALLAADLLAQRRAERVTTAGA